MRTLARRCGGRWRPIRGGKWRSRRWRKGWGLESRNPARNMPCVEVGLPRAPNVLALARCDPMGATPSHPVLQPNVSQMLTSRRRQMRGGIAENRIPTHEAAQAGSDFEFARFAADICQI